MDRQTILTKLFFLIQKSIGEQVLEINESDYLIEDLGLDSFDRIFLIEKCEKEFNVLLNDDLGSYETVKDLLDDIEKALK